MIEHNDRLTLCGAVEKVSRRETSCVELVEFFLDEIERKNSQTNSFIRVLKKEARERASLADKRSGKKGDCFPLNGVPIAVKDLFDIKGVPTTCGSLARRDYIPLANSVIVQRLLDAGAIILGKLNMHEFAFGPTSENVAFGDVKNPWNFDYIAGGSSGGSAAAVADGLCLGSLGSDTGGSIRIPASLCGVVGMKPTAGCINLGGVFPLSWTLDNVGPLANNAKDCALLLQVILDPESKEKIDATVSNEQTNIFRKWKVGIVDNFPVPIESEVKSGFERACEIIRSFMKTTERFKIPYFSHYKTIADLIMTCEACSIHEVLLAKEFDSYGQEVRPKIIAGNFISSTDYLQAIKLRSELTSILLAAMGKFDLLVLPTTPIVSPKIGENLVRIGKERYGVKHMLGILTRPFSVCGLPAASVPCGFSKNGLPIGIQIVGKPYHDNLVISVAEAYERKRDALNKG